MAIDLMKILLQAKTEMSVVKNNFIKFFPCDLQLCKAAFPFYFLINSSGKPMRSAIFSKAVSKVTSVT